MGNLYVADQGNHRIRKIDANGIITTVAGDGTKGFNGDGKLATKTQLSFPMDIIFDSHNNMYIADGGNQYRKEAGNARVFKITYTNISDSACGGITEGLIACYPFSGNANDASGNENHGAVKGATLTQDRFGNANSAYQFDGSNDYLDAPSLMNCEL